MDKVVAILAALGELKTELDDDWVDRLTRKYTTVFLLVFALLVSTKQYVGEPIHCWLPAQFTPNHEKYANNVCWVVNTYYVSNINNNNNNNNRQQVQRRLPSNDSDKVHIGYYQWVPMLLISQSILCILPCLIWRLIRRKSGINLKRVMDAAIAINKTECIVINRDRNMTHILSHLEKHLSLNIKQRHANCSKRLYASLAKRCVCIGSTLHGNYLSCTYLCVKFLYLVNSISQLFILNVFLSTDYHLYGMHVINALLKRQNAFSKTSEIFPRITMCDFTIRHLANTHKHTVQCVLPINLFNEKIYLFLWFWFVFLSLVNCVSLFKWIRRLGGYSSRVNFIRKQLKTLNKYGRITNKETDSVIDKFVGDYIKHDGVFICWLIAKNIGESTSAQICAGLWDEYCKEHRFIPRDRIHFDEILTI